MGGEGKLTISRSPLSAACICTGLFGKVFAYRKYDETYCANGGATFTRSSSIAHSCWSDTPHSSIFALKAFVP